MWQSRSMCFNTLLSIPAWGLSEAKILEGEERAGVLEVHPDFPPTEIVCASPHLPSFLVGFIHFELWSWIKFLISCQECRELGECVWREASTGKGHPLPYIQCWSLQQWLFAKCPYAAQVILNSCLALHGRASMISVGLLHVACSTNQKLRPRANAKYANWTPDAQSYSITQVRTCWLSKHTCAGVCISKCRSCWAWTQASYVSDSILCEERKMSAGFVWLGRLTLNMKELICSTLWLPGEGATVASPLTQLNELQMIEPEIHILQHARMLICSLFLCAWALIYIPPTRCSCLSVRLLYVLARRRYIACSCLCFFSLSLPRGFPVSICMD